MTRPISILAAAIVLFAAPALTQEPAAQGALRIFLDCPTTFCDLDYYRREVAFVNYVRDRQDAELHILVRTQRTGGGVQYEVNFIGLEQFEGKTDTLVFATSSTDTQEERREALRDALRMGLMRYVHGTPVADDIRITYGTPGGQRQAPQTRPEDDPWNFWVFRTGANGNVSLFESQKFYRISGNVSANRVTEAWKINLNARGSYNESRFTLTDSVLVSTRESFNGSALVVRSISDHWSVGGRSSVSSSTFDNYDLTLRFAPAIEFSVWRYDESSNRGLTFMYDIGVNQFAYGDLTVFNKLDEVLLDQQLTIRLNLVQAWGQSSFTLSGENYLMDFAQHRISFGGNFNIRLVRGLNFNMFGNVARIKNERNILRGGASDDEILVQQRRLGTNYELFTGFGFNYTFGSIFNNVVNPRFTGGGGGFFFFN